MEKFSKGDYIHTIPLNTCLVKRRFRDDKNKLWYTVKTPSGSIFYIPRTLTKGLASESAIRVYKEQRKKYQTNE